MIPDFPRMKGGAALVGIRPGEAAPGPFGLYGGGEDDAAADIEDPTASEVARRPLSTAPAD
ncbi:hypothetical protein ITI46_08005 [Streptomyces oryzae]|uniref:Uncharacterized protein n=1 Tax=Streptomyces oryzae TaxID=1434886 RepID=A0ABS3X8D7_9ACTN|nr:hypothetical protein [Streptomyces oryzae]MBO8191626.1 hypothetical protein [Streptomyces oryzae]